MQTRTVVEGIPQDRQLSPDERHFMVFDRSEMTTDGLVLYYKYAGSEPKSG